MKIDEIIHIFTPSEWFALGLALLWLVAVVAHMISRQHKPGPTLFACESCQHIGLPKHGEPGSNFMEVFLLIFLAPFGIIYGIVRQGQAVQSCPECDSSALVPVNSKRGRQIQSAIIDA